jgi:flagellum-specific peptidoglycan hydrolase FlgJ
MNASRYLIATFLIGIAAGIVLMYAYYAAQRSDDERASNSLVDFIIAQWTGADSSIIVQEQGAQIPASKELPAARAGFFPDTVRELAKMVEVQYNVPAAVILAQWALESKWGKNNLGVSNYFGHSYEATKQFVSNARFVRRSDRVSVNGVLHTGPKRKFAVYDNIAQCFDVHGKYLSQSRLYAAAFYTSNAEQFAKVIALHYAQDPDYSLKLITIMRRYGLEQ